MRGYDKIFKVKYGDKDKHNKQISFHVNDEKLLEKCKTIWTKIEDLKDIEINALLVYDDRYMKTKITTYSDKIYTNFRYFKVPGDDIECESLQSFLLTVCLYAKTNITSKYIYTIMLIKLCTSE